MTQSVFFQPGFAFLIGEALDGVAEHCAGHGPVPWSKPSFQGLLVSLPGFPQKPANRLLYQVMGMAQEDVRDGECV